MQDIFYIEVFFWVTPACVWCCDASNTFTEHENYQTSGEHNKRQRPDHRETFAANSCVCMFFFPFILDVKFVGSTGQGHTGFLIHVSSAVRAFIFSNGGFSRSFPLSTVKSN